MVMGAGGEAMKGLIENYMLKHLLWEKSRDVDVGLEALDDSAVVDDWAFTIDGHTVTPYFFPGGDIGRLSVAGTVNDLSVIGARPLALALGMIIEEGFPISDLDKIVSSVGETSKEADVHVVTGDTKVVERGLPGGIFVTTAGIGRRHPSLLENWEKTGRRGGTPWLLDSKLKEGDKIIVSGTVGDHGIAVLSQREGYGFETDIISDVMPVNHILDSALRSGGVVAAKDPTRGGVANALNEWAEKSQVGIKIYEESIPIKEGVRAACEMLGIDPLEIGNEGKVLLVVVNDSAEDILEVIRKQKGGEDAEIIGEVSSDVKGVVMESVTGGLRIVDPPTGDPVPRIC
ncbi:MAG: hydrogenase expression/formation protein HypE [Thermoplasmata archaeon]|nr:hydrogenase expression/formation protein HypE [Thermoplasmata archaeon]